MNDQDHLPVGLAFIKEILREVDYDAAKMKGVAFVVEELRNRIKVTEIEVKEMQEQYDSITNSAEPRNKKPKVDELSNEPPGNSENELLREQLELAEKELDLAIKKLELAKKDADLAKKDKELFRMYVYGEYYAITNQLLQVEEDGELDRDAWNNFTRDSSDTCSLPCWRPTNQTENKDPYQLRRDGALNTSTLAPGSDTARTRDSYSNNRSARDQIWPTDIFGVPLSGEVGHLIPVGKQVHKQWMNVAAGVLGPQINSQNSDTAATKRKTVCGCVYNSHPNRDALTGVVHFVSNKIRMAGQRDQFDGDKPTVLIIPVMTLDDAKGWRGGGYDAICLAGMPRDCSFAGVSADTVYKNISLTDTMAMDNKDIEHATRGQVTMACALLRQAVVALRSMIASLTDDDIGLVGNSDSKYAKQLREAVEQANGQTQRAAQAQVSAQVQHVHEAGPIGVPAQGEDQKQAREQQQGEVQEQTQAQLGAQGQEEAHTEEQVTWKVPRLIENFDDPDQNPVCLIKFGGHDSNTHPAPDPLLLVLRAANSFGKMAGLRMLATGSPHDDDDDDDDDSINEGDRIAEEAFLRAREQARRDDLPKRLGQPKGY